MGQGDADYTQAIEIDPTDAVPFHNRALARAANGDDGKSADDFAEAIRLDPDDLEALTHHAAASYLKGDFDKALADSAESSACVEGFGGLL